MTKKLTKNEIELRTEERRTKLIEQCRYYKGDINNPWLYCYNPTLVWRKDMWELEKHWVEALSKSYRCETAKHEFLDSIHLTEYIKAIGIPVSLMNHILVWAKTKADNENTAFKTIDVINIVEQYLKLTPLARDYRMYFAYYMGDIYDEEEDKKYLSAEEVFLKMGYSQERLMKDGKHKMFSDWYYADMAKDCRGEEGIRGWYADSKFPSLQKDIVSFMCANWGTWCPYDDVDALAEQYLFYHYPGDKKLRGTKWGEYFWEDSDLRFNCEIAADKIAKTELGKEIDTELYMMFDKYCYFRPIFDYSTEKEYKYPVLIKVDFATYKATILCNEESKSINNEIQAYIQKYAIENSCIFYKGEDTNPFDDDDWKHSQWQYEKSWVLNESGETRANNPKIIDFILKFPDELSFDQRPLSFKAFLYDYMTRRNAGYPGEEESYRKYAKDLNDKIAEYQNDRKQISKK